MPVVCRDVGCSSMSGWFRTESRFYSSINLYIPGRSRVHNLSRWSDNTVNTLFRSLCLSLYTEPLSCPVLALLFAFLQAQQKELSMISECRSCSLTFSFTQHAELGWRFYSHFSVSSSLFRTVESRPHATPQLRAIRRVLQYGAHDFPVLTIVVS